MILIKYTLPDLFTVNTDKIVNVNRITKTYIGPQNSRIFLSYPDHTSNLKIIHKINLTEHLFLILWKSIPPAVHLQLEFCHPFQQHSLVAPLQQTHSWCCGPCCRLSWCQDWHGLGSNPPSGGPHSSLHTVVVFFL